MWEFPFCPQTPHLDTHQETLAAALGSCIPWRAKREKVPPRTCLSEWLGRGETRPSSPAWITAGAGLSHCLSSQTARDRFAHKSY